MSPGGGSARGVIGRAQVKGDGVITRNVADAALKLLRIDDLGLDDMDRAIILTLIQKFGGGPVGLSSLSVAVGEERQTLEEVHEPYLIQIGFLKRTSTGRMATHLAYRHFGIAAPVEGGITGGVACWMK